MTTRKIVLGKPADWETWISFLKTKATNLGVWELVNPNLTTKPPAKVRPVKPSYTPPTDPTKINKEQYELFKIQAAVYKLDQDDYEREQRALTDITNFIHESLSVQTAVFTKGVAAHPWDQLRALKTKLAPTDQARKMEVERRYHHLKKGPANRDIEAWIQDWELMHADAIMLSIGETLEDQRPQRDFLVAVAKYEPAFSDNYLLRISDEGEKFEMQRLIEKFRHLTRLKHTAHVKDSHAAAFAANANAPGQQPTFNNQRTPMPTPRCVCGTVHWFAECLYLRPEKRPKGWRGDDRAWASVKEAFKKKELKDRINAAIKRGRDYDAMKDQEKSLNQTNPAKSAAAASTLTPTDLIETEILDIATFAASTFFAVDSFSLRTSWILDGGSNAHVCNSTMKDRFTKTRDGEGEYMAAGREIFQVECYGTVQITVASPTGPKTVTLTNVYYVPDFMTNAVAGHRLEEKGVHFDSWKMHLHVEGRTLYYVKPFNGHKLLEDNTSPSDQSTGAFPTSTAPPSPPASTNIAPKPKEASAHRWHQMLAHASGEVIQHLESSAEGVRITDGASVPKTNNCESCALAKAREIVSRKSDNEEYSDAPFYRISYDIIPMHPSMTREKWISHIACYSTDFNLLYTHRSKSESTELLHKSINLITNRFNRKVVFIRSDGESSLGGEFDNLLTKFGITFEASTPDTQAQNGHAERKGAVLIMKARALRIAAGLPQYLWHEIIKASAYLANRTPMRKHQWKTPYELVIGQKPSLAHLQVYGCKAYPLNKKIPKSLKLQERAHIGHLVGYEARNIFRIWIPSQRKVVRSRDVLFNDDGSYDAHEVDLMQVIEEPMLETTFDPLHLQYYTRISDFELNDEEEVEEDENNRVTPANEEFCTVSEIVDYLPTPRSSENSSVAYTPASSNLSRAPSETPAPPDNASTSNAPHPPQPGPSAPARRMIGLDLDEANILPEGVGRRRAPRRQAYATALTEGVSGGISTFHEAFSAFSMARDYQPPVQAPPVQAFSSSKLHRDSLPPEPKNFRQVIKHPHSAGFQLAIQTEIKSLISKGTWKEVPTEQAIKSTPVIPTMWVFKYKFDEDGYLVKYKARLCARGDLQHTQQDTYAATLAARIFRALMAIVAAYDLETRQYDAVNAFANSPIDEAIYCKPPEGWTGTSGIYLLLLRALYGLKQAPSLWYRQLSQALIEFGFEPIPEAECLFLSQNSHLLLFFFVDDIVLIYDRRYIAEVEDFQSLLFARFEMRYLGELEWFLGIHITRDRAKQLLSLCQESYVEKLINKFNIDMTAKQVSTPLPTVQLIKHEGQATPQEIHAYQQRVGSINFAAVISRPDIAHAASKLSEFLTNPSKSHLEFADRTIQYLGHTKRLAIQFSPESLFHSPSPSDLNTTFLASSDASFADDPSTRFSSQGYGFKLFNGMIDWKATKQRTVTTSSTEAELLAISATGKELIWWSRLFEAINFSTNQTPFIQCDNAQTIRALTAPKFTTQLRHVDIHRHWLRQEIGQGKITIAWVSSAKILADGLTKALPPQRHNEFIKLLGLTEHL